MKRKQSNLYDYDPCPVKFRGEMDPELLNNFVIDQQKYATEYNETPMWLTLFKMKYEDFQIDKDDLYYYFEMTKIFASNMFIIIIRLTCHYPLRAGCTFPMFIRSTFLHSTRLAGSMPFSFQSFLS